MTKNRIFAIFLTAFLLLGMVPAMSFSAAAATHGDYTYRIDGDEITLTDYKGPGVGTSIVIPTEIDGIPVTAIADNVYKGLITVGELDIPEGIKSIGDNAFDGCPGLKRLTLPTTLTHIGKFAFRNCNALPALNIDETNPNYSSVDGVLFNKDKTVLIQCPGGKTGSYTVPMGVKEIGESAFFGCMKLTDIAVAASVTTVGDNAFQNCSKAVGISLTPAVTTLGKDVFAKCASLVSAVLPSGAKEIPAGTFRDCNALTTVSIPNGVKKIGDDAFFNCSSLTTLTVPAGVTEIGDEAFSGCAALVSLALSGVVETIGADAFDGCDALTLSGYTGSYIETYANEHEIPFTTLSPLPVFIDLVGGTYYESAVRWAVDNGVTKGTSDKTFSPEGACTRGQVVTFLWRALGCPKAKTTKSPFTDTTVDSHDYEAILWAADNGITTGTSATTFSPTDRVDRGQFVTFLYRAAGLPEVTKDTDFADVTDKNAFYYQAVVWAVENDITLGTGKGNFSPSVTCSRGQVVTFLYRFFEA